MPWGLFILLAVGFALLWAWVVMYTVWMLTHPPRRTYAWAVSRSLPGDPGEVVIAIEGMAARRGLKFDSWTFSSRSNELPVWDIQGLDATGPTIIITHGWGDARRVMLGRVAALAPIACRIVLWDMTGHGDAPNRTRCELGTKEATDLCSLLDRLTTDQTTGATSLLLYGFSLGAGVSIEAAVQRPEGIVGVVAESPYRIPPTPARNLCRLRGLPYRVTLPAAMAALGLLKGYGWSWALAALRGRRDGVPRFDRAELARELAPTIPLLVLHADGDPVCPIADGREIALAAHNGRIVELPHSGHTDVWFRPELALTMVSEIRALLAIARPPHE